jgi:hypothetical protein
MERGDLLIGRGLTLAMAAAARRNGGLWIKRGSGGGGGRERESLGIGWDRRRGFRDGGACRLVRVVCMHAACTCTRKVMRAHLQRRKGDRSRPPHSPVHAAGCFFLTFLFSVVSYIRSEMGAREDRSMQCLSWPEERQSSTKLSLSLSLTTTASAGHENKDSSDLSYSCYVLHCTPWSVPCSFLSFFCSCSPLLSLNNQLSSPCCG